MLPDSTQQSNTSGIRWPFYRPGIVHPDFYIIYKFPMNICQFFHLIRLLPPTSLVHQSTQLFYTDLLLTTDRSLLMTSILASASPVSGTGYIPVRCGLESFSKSPMLEMSGVPMYMFILCQQIFFHFRHIYKPRRNCTIVERRFTTVTKRIGMNNLECRKHEISFCQILYDPRFSFFIKYIRERSDKG